MHLKLFLFVLVTREKLLEFLKLIKTLLKKILKIHQFFSLIERKQFNFSIKIKTLLKINEVNIKLKQRT